jgi:sulfane dehydrogenase subunit SoxC
MTDDTSEPIDPAAAADPDRRRFVRRGLLLAPALAAPAVAAAQGAEPWMRAPGAAFTDYGLPSPHERQAIRRAGLNHRGIDGNGAAWTPLERMEGSLTPNGLHFVRNHNGTPAIDPVRHRLLVHGLVRQALEFDIESLLRYPMQSQQVFVECGGNSNAGWHEEPAQRPASLVHGLVSCSEWTGVPLRLVLQEVRVDPAAQWLVATGADAGAFHMSLPLAKAMDDCLLALFQNGERLRPDNGYPLRLLVPGWKGVLSVKWLQSLQLADQPAMGRNETARYTELLPSGQARQFTGVMEVKSLITTPSHGHSLPGPGLHELRGLAWSGRGRIVRVEVSADGGARWTDAALQGPVLPRCLTRFRAAFKWDGQPVVLKSRATDETGSVQPERAALVKARGSNGYFHYNAIVAWAIDEDGAVTHVYA